MTSNPTTADFVVAIVRDDLAAEGLRRAAGLGPVPRAVVMRRFVTFTIFLHTHAPAATNVAGSPRRVHEFTQLCRSDLTAEGFAFVRAVYRAWLSRMGRDAGDAGERVRLEGWLTRFRAWRGGDHVLGRCPRG